MNKMTFISIKKQMFKTIFLIFIGTLCYSFQAQTNLNGYCVNYALNDISACLTFEKVKNFTYEYSGDTGVFEYGQGDYEISSNKLILNYHRTDPLKVGYHVSKIWTNKKDSINLNFKVMDFEGNPLPAVSVAYKDSLSRYGYNGVASNKMGIALIGLKRDRTELEVEIINVGFRHYKFTIDKNYNCDISVFLQKDGGGVPIKNQIDTMELENMRLKYFTVNNAEEEIMTWRKIEN